MNKWNIAFLYTYLIVSINLVLHDFFLPTRMNDSKVEVYLIGGSEGRLVRNQTQFFMPLPFDASDSIFLYDSEIVSYEIVGDMSDPSGNGPKYYLNLSESGGKKVEQLNLVDVCCGRKFAISVDGKPGFGVYFWNVFSSYSCDWIVTIPVKPFRKLILEKGYPTSFFTKNHPDPRAHEGMLEAFRKTGRLVRR